MGAAIVLQDPFAGIGKELLTSLLGAVVRVPVRLFLGPLMRGRGDDVLTLLELNSSEQLEAFLLSRRGRWNAETMPLLAASYVSTKLGRRLDPEKVLADVKRAYDLALELVNRSDARDSTVAAARIALFSGARSIGAIARKEIDESRLPKVSRWSALAALQEPVMVLAALLVGLNSPELVRGENSLQLLAERLLRDTDMLAQLIGDARRDPEAGSRELHEPGSSATVAPE